jgi:hypothetical protein
MLQLQRDEDTSGEATGHAVSCVAEWVRARFIFERCSVRISDGISFIPAEVFRDISQYLHENAPMAPLLRYYHFLPNLS